MMMAITQARQSVLDWFDRNARDLPWRVKGGLQDPYIVWLSEIMLQQTTVQAVIPYFLKFTRTWPDVTALANAKDDDVMQAWAGLGYYSRARNLLKAARYVRDELKGVFPRSEKELKKLPGVGDYTAAAIAAIAYNRPCVVVDGNIERIAARYYRLTTPMPGLKAEVKEAIAPMMCIVDGRQSDFVQALMDIGSSVCTPQSPKCGVCPLQPGCQADDPQSLPVKAPKKVKPHRVGRAFVIFDEQGRIALEKRDESWMLGGMWGLPSSTWHIKKSPDYVEEAYQIGEGIQAKVTHVFTHFSLELSLHRAHIDKAPDHWRFVDAEELRETGLPSLYQKAVKLIEFPEL